MQGGKEGAINLANDAMGAAQDGRRNSQIGIRGVQGAQAETQEFVDRHMDVVDQFVEKKDQFSNMVDQAKDNDNQALFDNMAQGQFPDMSKCSSEDMEKGANLLCDRLGFRTSVCLTFVCIGIIFTVGLLSMFGVDVNMDTELKKASGLSLGISLLDVLKERVVTLTNWNINKLQVPGHEHFDVARELTFVWLWLPISWATLHPQTIIGVLVEFLIAGMQSMLGVIKLNDLGQDCTKPDPSQSTWYLADEVYGAPLDAAGRRHLLQDGEYGLAGEYSDIVICGQAEDWAKAFVIAGAASSVIGTIYCLSFRKVSEDSRDLRAPVQENVFSRLAQTKSGGGFLKLLGFVVKHQKDIADKVSGKSFGQGVDEELGDEMPDDEYSDFADPNKWALVDRYQPGQGILPVPPDVAGETQTMSPQPSSLVSMIMPFLGTLAAVGSIILHAILYHDIYAEPENKVFNYQLAGQEINEHALSGAQLMMVVAWLALSIVAGVAYIDLAVKREYNRITTKPVLQRVGFDWINDIPSSIRRKPVWTNFIRDAFQTPSLRELEILNEEPRGVLEGLGEVAGLFSCQFKPWEKVRGAKKDKNSGKWEPVDESQWQLFWAAVFGNFAKYFIVVRALVFAVFDNNNQGFLMWYIVPEGVLIIIFIWFFYRMKWDMEYKNIKLTYKKRLISQPRSLTPPPSFAAPLPLWTDYSRGGLEPLPGYTNGGFRPSGPGQAPPPIATSVFTGPMQGSMFQPLPGYRGF